MLRKVESFFGSQDYFFGKPPWFDDQTYFILPGKRKYTRKNVKKPASLA